MPYHTVVYMQVWQPDSDLTLWMNKGTSKETFDKKLRSAVKSGRPRKGALSQLPSDSRMSRSLEKRLFFKFSKYRKFY